MNAKKYAYLVLKKFSLGFMKIELFLREIKKKKTALGDFLLKFEGSF